MSIPHFKLPFEIHNNKVIEVEQDSIAEVAGCVEAVLRYPIGYRVERPDFGIPDYAFSQSGTSIEAVETAIALWEPRADATIDHNLDVLDDLIDRIRVSVSGRKDI